jgi:opacity protein-like surface antigen
MKKFALIAGAAVLPVALPGVAHAQETAGASTYIGAQVGLHDLGVSADDADADDFDIDDSAVVYGVYGGVDFNLGGSAIVGVEGNYSMGNGPIDAEYGIAGRIGARTGGGTVIFARLGYQWVNVDPEGLLGIDEDLVDDDEDLDDTIDDYLVGVGVDIAAGPNMGFRIAVDTISFDTLRPSVGLHFKF